MGQITTRMEYISCGPRIEKQGSCLKSVNRAAVRGFITYLKTYEERKVTNREPRT